MRLAWRSLRPGYAGLSTMGDAIGMPTSSQQSFSQQPGGGVEQDGWLASSHAADTGLLRRHARERPRGTDPAGVSDGGPCLRRLVACEKTGKRSPATRDSASAPQPGKLVRDGGPVIHRTKPGPAGYDSARGCGVKAFADAMPGRARSQAQKKTPPSLGGVFLYAGRGITKPKSSLRGFRRGGWVGA